MDREHRRRGMMPMAVNIRRWLGALDALAPHLIASIAVAIARHAFASTRPATLAVVIAVALLGAGTGMVFFWDMSDAHLTWPVAFVLCVVFVPLLALHSRVESAALAAPVAIHLLPLAFTWTGLLIVTGLVIGAVFIAGVEHPAWAGAVVSPLPVLLGAAPLLGLDPSRPAVLTAVLYAFALAEIVSGVAWLAPERRRWPIAAASLTLAAFVVGRAFATTPHHLPGRVLLLGDAALALMTGLIALAAPLLCPQLAGAAAMRRRSRS